MDYGRVRIFGERSLPNNTIKRFNAPFQVPPTCDINRIRGKFEGGLVAITMPKRVISEPDETPQPTDQAPKTPVQEKEQSPDKDQAPTTPPQEPEPSPDKDQAPTTAAQETEPSPDEDQALETPEQETEPSPENKQAPKSPA